MILLGDGFESDNAFGFEIDGSKCEDGFDNGDSCDEDICDGYDDEYDLDIG